MLKRKYKKVYEYLYKMMFYEILFWNKCESCKNDFKFKKGWRAVIGTWCNGSGHWIYICPECASDKYEATEVLSKLRDTFINSKPPPPPPPPKPDIEYIHEDLENEDIDQNGGY